MEIQIDEKTKETILIDTSISKIISPTSEYVPDSNMGIESIQLDEYCTRIDFIYIAPKNYSNGGWVQIDGRTYIRPVGSDKNYYLIKAINIPIAPDKHFFKKCGQVLKYTLLFPALPKNIQQIDIIERLAPGTFFNFFRVNLTHGKPLLLTVNNHSN